MRKKLAECGNGSARAAAGVESHELAVANRTFLLERLGRDCANVQRRRELTVNELDAIAARADGAGERVIWDLDWQRVDASGGHVRKLSMIDTGTGMTLKRPRCYINQLAASGREQSSTGNFGVGAKVAAGSRNPLGQEYRWLVDGYHTSVHVLAKPGDVITRGRVARSSSPL